MSIRRILFSCPRSPAQHAAEETQQCADAATEHVRFLEEKAETDRAEAEAAAAALQTQLEGVQVGDWEAGRTGWLAKQLQQPGLLQMAAAECSHQKLGHHTLTNQPCSNCLACRQSWPPHRRGWRRRRPRQHLTWRLLRRLLPRSCCVCRYSTGWLLGHAELMSHFSHDMAFAKGCVGNAELLYYMPLCRRRPRRSTRLCWA